MKRPVTIVGAGLSGLVSAYYLVGAGYDVEIYEASARAGGLISTIETSEGLVETAANALLNSRKVEELFSHLGLTLQGTRASARRRYIFNRAHPRRWPLGFRDSFRFIRGILRILFFRESANPQDGESTHAWGRRLFGAEAASVLIDGALQGIYAGDPSRLSARLIFGPLLNRKRNSARPKVKGSVAPPNGMGELISKLESHLTKSGVRIHYSTSFSQDALSSQEPTPHPLVIATNPKAAATILRERDKFRAQLLDKIEMSPLVSATAFFEKTAPASRGFGVLFPPRESRGALGVLKNDFIFEGRSRSLFSETWIMGGAFAPEICSQTDQEILNTITSERLRVFGLEEKPKAARITRWPAAVPHYTIELERILPALKAPVKNVFLAGNYLGELGLAKIVERASRLPERLASEGQWS